MSERGKQLYRSDRWHVWTRPGFRLGVAVVPQPQSPTDRRTTALLWIGSLLIERKLGKPAGGVPQCKVPPEGWYCTREPGHDGPCAAYPDHPIPVYPEGFQ